MKLRRERGNSIVEFSLMTPWLIMMFIGAMDWGFYAYSLIATEAAARVACLYTSSSSSTVANSTQACTYAIGQLKMMPNIGAAGVSSCSASPLVVSATSVTGPDGNTASQVSVTYTTPVYIPMILKSGSTALPKQVSITRTIQMRVRG